MADDTYHIDYIKKMIDKTFLLAKEQPHHPMNFRYTIMLYCFGYIQACVNFGIISPEKHGQFVEYIKGLDL